MSESEPRAVMIGSYIQARVYDPVATAAGSDPRLAGRFFSLALADNAPQLCAEPFNLSQLLFNPRE